MYRKLLGTLLSRCQAGDLQARSGGGAAFSTHVMKVPISHKVGERYVEAPLQTPKQEQHPSLSRRRLLAYSTLYSPVHFLATGV